MAHVLSFWFYQIEEEEDDANPYDNQPGAKRSSQLWGETAPYDNIGPDEGTAAAISGYDDPLPPFSSPKDMSPLHLTAELRRSMDSNCALLGDTNSDDQDLAAVESNPYLQPADLGTNGGEQATNRPVCSALWSYFLKNLFLPSWVVYSMP